MPGDEQQCCAPEQSGSGATEHAGSGATEHAAEEVGLHTPPDAITVDPIIMGK